MIRFAASTTVTMVSNFDHHQRVADRLVDLAPGAVRVDRSCAYGCGTVEAMAGSADRNPWAPAFVRVLVTMTIVAGVLVGHAQPAAACLCGAQPIGDQLADADGAFIGTFLGAHPERVSTQTGSQGFVASNHVFTFDVDEWIKGDRPPGLVDVTVSMEGSCALFLAPGSNVAMTIWMDGARPRTGMCSFLDEAELAGARVAPETSMAPAQFLLSPNWPEKPVLLAADGSVVGIRPDGAHGRRQVSCGGSIVAEERNREVAVVDVATFEDVEVLRFRRGATRLLCDGDWLLGISEREGQLEVFDIRTRRPVAQLAGNEAYVGLHDGRLTVLGPGEQNDLPRWQSIDLSSGSVELLATFDPEQRIDSAELGPGADRLAYTGEDGEGRNFVATLDLRSGAEVRKPLDDTSHVQWLDGSRVFVSNARPDGTPTVRMASDLSVVAEIDPLIVGQVELLGPDGLIAVSRGTVVGSSATGGAAAVWNQLPFTAAMISLDEPVDVRFDWKPFTAIDTPLPSPAIESLPVSTIDPDTLVDPMDLLPGLRGDTADVELVAEPDDGAAPSAASGSAADVEPEEAANWAFAVGGALLLLAVVALVARRRRTP